MSEHTKGPWRSQRIKDECTVIVECADAANIIAEADVDANARRIVAAINACEGIGTTDLVALGDTGLLAKANHNADVVKKQRDALLEALEAILPFAEEHQDCGPVGAGWKSDDMCKKLAAASDAVSKAKGGAQTS